MKTTILHITKCLALLALPAIFTISCSASGPQGQDSSTNVPGALIDYSKPETRLTVTPVAPAAPHSHSHDGEHQHGSAAAHSHGEGAVCFEHPKIHDLNMLGIMLRNPKQADKGKVTYRLEEPALISIRVQKQGTRELYLASIVNHEYRSSGEHTETWDGQDFSGNVVDMTQSFVSVRAEPVSNRGPGSMPLNKRSVEETVHKQYDERGHIHGEHHNWAEEVPYLKIVNIRKRQSVNGIITIEAEVDKSRRGYGNQYGYGVRYYIDNVLAHEEFYKPECDGQFSYRLDTTPFEDGEHMLYVGMCDHHEHAASAGVQVIINNSEQQPKQNLESR